MAKEPNPIDQHVGSRVRLRRVMLGAVEDFMAGKRPCGAGPDVDFPSIRSNAAVLEPGKAWQEVL